MVFLMACLNARGVPGRRLDAVSPCSEWLTCSHPRSQPQLAETVRGFVHSLHRLRDACAEQPGAACDSKNQPPKTSLGETCCTTARVSAQKLHKRPHRGVVVLRSVEGHFALTTHQLSLADDTASPGTVVAKESE